MYSLPIGLTLNFEIQKAQNQLLRPDLALLAHNVSLHQASLISPEEQKEYLNQLQYKVLLVIQVGPVSNNLTHNYEVIGSNLTVDM